MLNLKTMPKDLQNLYKEHIGSTLQSFLKYFDFESIEALVFESNGLWLRNSTAHLPLPKELIFSKCAKMLKIYEKDSDHSSFVKWFAHFHSCQENQFILHSYPGYVVRLLHAVKNDNSFKKIDCRTK